MIKEYYDSLRPIQQVDVSYIVNKAIEEMVNEQFDFIRMAASIELLKERIGQLDVVPRSMINERNGVSSCGSTEVNPQAKQRSL